MKSREMPKIKDTAKYDVNSGHTNIMEWVHRAAGEPQRLPGHAGQIMGCTYDVLFQRQGNEESKYRRCRVAEGYCTDTLFQDYFPDAIKSRESKDGNCGSQGDLRSRG